MACGLAHPPPQEDGNHQGQALGSAEEQRRQRRQQPFFPSAPPVCLPQLLANFFGIAKSFHRFCLAFFPAEPP